MNAIDKAIALAALARDLESPPVEWWTVRTADRDFEVFFCPPARRHEVQALYPGAAIHPREPDHAAGT
jgi:hypothetical protein